MRMNVVVSVVVVLLVAVIWYLVSPLFISTSLDEGVPVVSDVVVSGNFMNGEHAVSGHVSVLNVDSERVLRLEDFSTENGPELHVYLATDSSGSDFVDLGSLKATSGNLNYDVGSEVDLDVYDTVIVWCVPFGVNFGYAELA